MLFKVDILFLILLLLTNSHHFFPCSLVGALVLRFLIMQLLLPIASFICLFSVCDYALFCSRFLLVQCIHVCGQVFRLFPPVVRLVMHLDSYNLLFSWYCTSYPTLMCSYSSSSSSLFSVISVTCSSDGNNFSIESSQPWNICNC